jgi:MoxR-like ATPase
VTVEGTTHILPDPFMVIATQNPVEHAGVNDLPEAQLDRFQMLLSPGYPTEQDELTILRDRLSGDPISALEPVISTGRLRELIALVSRVAIDDRLLQYIIAAVRHTRQSDQLALGASPRSALQLSHLARAYALTHGRTYVIPDDVKTLFLNCLPHRLMVKVLPDDTLVALSEWKAQVLTRLVGEVAIPS